MGTAIEDATDDTYTVTATPANSNDVGKYIHVTATYNVGDGLEETASALISDYPVQAARGANSPPVFASSSVNRRVTEGKKGMTVGAPVTATDADGDVLNYTLAGDDAGHFEIDQKTGQIKTEMDLDFDDPADRLRDTAGNNTYVVTVTRPTPLVQPETTPVTVMITVTDANEKPKFTSGIEGMAARPRRRHDRHRSGLS